MKKNILIVSLVLLFAVSSVVYYRTTSNDSDLLIGQSGSVSYLEIEVSEEDLLNSEAIFKGKVLGIKEKIDYTSTPGEQVDHEANPSITFPVVVYEVVVIEQFKGLSRSRSENIVEVAVLDDITFCSKFKDNEEYVFFAMEHKDMPNVFIPVSYSQGVYIERNNRLESLMIDKTLSLTILDQIVSN
ncbi:MAG: hypothetical protein Q7J85_02865 [Bacillota bacterium]|nr:hypothetical protein [Bacillota bacterium]